MDLQDYFQSYQNYFWEWENEQQNSDSVFESVSIPNDSTIAYEAYIMETLEYLAEESIPPFGSFLLAVMATNAGAHQSIVTILNTTRQTFSLNEQSSAYGAHIKAEELLNIQASLPDAYKKGNRRRQLFQVLFSGCHNRLSKDKAQKILEAYRQNKDQLLKCGTKKPASYANFQKDFRTLELITDAFPNAAVIIEKMSGLPVLPEIEEYIADEPAATGKPDLIKDLTEEAKTFTVGSLIKRLWSGLNIPMHHFASGRQPLGGISDLTNKGDFDKLLISEFANDDEVFMSRLANNEALYIEREIPPENDKFLRVLLIDASLKNWGTPKVLAYAGAIAIATHPKTNIECKIFAIGESYKEVLYATVHDVINGLDILSPKLDASAGFLRFLECDIMAFNPEIFIVSSSGALKMPAVQKVMGEYHDKIKYIVEGDYQGYLNFYNMQNRSRKLVQHLFLPLDDLWQNKPAEKSSKKNVRRLSTRDMPYYPLLYPLRSNEIATFYLNGYIYYLSSNRSLFRTYFSKGDTSYYKYNGAELVLENLSIKSGGIHALGNQEGDYILVSYYKDEKLISYLNLNTSEYIKISFDGTKEGNHKILYHGETDSFYIFDAALKCYEIRKEGSQLALKNLNRSVNIESVYEVMHKTTGEFAYRPGSSLLQNYLPVIIDTNGNLHLNKHMLKVSLSDHDVHCSVNLVLDRIFTPQVASVYNSGHDMNRFIFPDGSEVIRDKRGMFTLKSSNPAIPEIYIPVSLQFNLGLATANEFAGNDYFYDDKSISGSVNKISVREFDAKYIKPFIKHITDHGA